MAGTNPYPQEVRERAVRMVLDQQGQYASQWEAMRSIAAKIGCSPETLRLWCDGPRSIQAAAAA